LAPPTKPIRGRSQSIVIEQFTATDLGQLVKPITDAATLALLREKLSPMLMPDRRFDVLLTKAWVLAKGWTVVPVVDSNHFDPGQVADIVKALTSIGLTECVAIATETVPELPEAYRVPVTTEGFQAFNNECGLFRYLLMDETGPGRGDR
jgi:hypothetical protein